MTLIYIIIAIVFITVIVKIVLFVIKHDRAPYIPTLDEVFPNQKDDIPAENFQFMQRVFTSFLIAHGVNDACEIDESIEPSSSELYSDDEFDLLGIIDIMSLVKDYSELVSQPNLEEFVILFIKSYYDEVKGYYTFRFSDLFSS